MKTLFLRHDVSWDQISSILSYITFPLGATAAAIALGRRWPSETVTTLLLDIDNFGSLRNYRSIETKNFRFQISFHHNYGTWTIIGVGKHVHIHLHHTKLVQLQEVNHQNQLEKFIIPPLENRGFNSGNKGKNFYPIGSDATAPFNVFFSAAF